MFSPLPLIFNSLYFRSQAVICGITKIQKNFLSTMCQQPSLEEINILRDDINPNVFNVQLNRAAKRNTFTDNFWSELKVAFSYLAEEPTCRAIVLSANGPVFSAGIDLKDGVKELSKITSDDLDVARKTYNLRKLIKRYQESFSSLEQCPKPVIAAIHSHCIGAGINLVSCADVRYASNDAIFSIREVDIGIVADVGILQRINKIVGNDSWSREMAFSGRDATSSEALKFGFISRILDTKEDCFEAAMSLSRQIALKSPAAVQGTKLAMNYARSHGIEDSSEWIRNWNASMLQTTDIAENVKAKLTKSNNYPIFKDF